MQVHDNDIDPEWWTTVLTAVGLDDNVTPGIAGADPAPAQRASHPAAHAGDGLVGQLHDVEMVDHQGGVRQVLAHGGPVGRAHVDRHHRHAVAPGLGACGQPGPGILAGAALDLP